MPRVIYSSRAGGRKQRRTTEARVKQQVYDTGSAAHSTAAMAPIPVLDEQPAGSTFAEDAEKDMDGFGIDNVRGGSYCEEPLHI